MDTQNAAIFLAGDVAATMGKGSITDNDGKVTVVVKIWQFKKDDKR